MWNHAPDMWAGMKQRGIVKAELSQESAADLFAYFVSRAISKSRATPAVASWSSPKSTAPPATASTGRPIRRRRR